MRAENRRGGRFFFAVSLVLLSLQASAKEPAEETSGFEGAPAIPPDTLRGVYTIRHVATERYADAYENEEHDFLLVTRPAQHSGTQRWFLTPLGGNVYTIQQRSSSGRYVDAHESEGKDYALVTRAFQNNDSQKWVLTPVGAGTYTVRQKSSGRYVDAHATADKDYAIVTRPRQGNTTQAWVIKRAP